MKKYILILFATVTSLQTYAQVLEVYLDNTTKKFACKDSSNCKYTIKAYKNTNNYNTIEVYKAINGGTATETESFTYTSGDNKTYSARIYNKSCVWGSVPTDDGVYLGQTKTIDGVTYEVHWANWNLGASSKTEAGCYFSWGESGSEHAYNSSGVKITSYNADKAQTTSTYSANTSTNTYYLGQYSSDGQIMNDSYDPAVLWWGNGWRTPTVDEIEYLVSDCSIGNNVSEDAYTITGNGNSITIPRKGYYDGTSLKNEGETAFTNKIALWSRTAGTALVGFHNSNVFDYGGVGHKLRSTTEFKYYMGLNIRPVKLVPKTSSAAKAN